MVTFTLIFLLGLSVGLTPIVLKKLRVKNRSHDLAGERNRKKNQFMRAAQSIQHLPCAAFAVHWKRRHFVTNQTFKRLFPHLSADAFHLFSSESLGDWIHPQDRESLADFIQAAQVVQRGMIESTFRVRHTNQPWIWVQIKLSSFGEQNRLQSLLHINHRQTNQILIGICEDVSLHKSTLRALRSREARSRKLLSGVTDAAIFILDDMGSIQFCNEATHAVLGFEEHELSGKHISSICPKTDVISGKSFEILKKVNKNSNYEEISRKIKKDGSGFWAQVLITELETGQLDEHRYCFVVRDISRYKKEERELHEWKNRFEQLAENVKEAFWIYDLRSANMDYVSPIFAQLLCEEKIQKHNFFNIVLKSVQKQDLFLVRSFMSDLTLGQDSAVEFRIALPNNQDRWLSMRAFAVKDGLHKVHRIVGITEDITEQREAQLALHQAKEDADAANRAKTEFLANMSHEIRTPLGAILGFAELLGDKQSADEDRAAALNAILRNGKQLSKIIDEILDLSKVEAGKLELELEEFELLSFIEDVTSFLALQAREKAIQLSIEKNGILPERIRSDATKLRQILLNMIGNAIKFTDRGHIKITIALELNSEHSMLTICVTDSGQGLTAEQQNRIFRPFVQADSSTSRKYGGTGLGLVLSRRFAQLLGGDLSLVWSSPGYGSCFEIKIDVGPSSDLSLIETSVELKHERPPVMSSTEHCSLQGIQTLVIDDAADNRLIVERFLSRAGASVEHADNGMTGAEKIFSKNYDVVIMDIQMPEYDGYQTVELLRSRGIQTPVIALSAHAMKEDRDRSLRSGFNEHLCKPINRALLIETVAALTQPHQ